MGITQGGERTKLGSYRDLALGFLIAASVSLGVFFLLNARSPGASALDMKLALAAFAVAGICIIASRTKLPVLSIALTLVAAYSMTYLLIRVVRTRSAIAGITEIALGATMLYFRPPAWHKNHFRLTLPGALLLHGAYQLLSK